jgi:hypothetical protein
MGVGEHSDAFLLSEFVTIACLESMIRLDGKEISPKTKPDGSDGGRPALQCEERVSQEDFPRQGEQDRGLHSKSFRPCPGRRVEKARRLSSQASTEAAISSLIGYPCGEAPGALPFSGAKGRGGVTCVPHSHASASR